MTATERLRALLDKRGVEYETYHDAAITEVDAVFWQDRNGQPCSAIGNADDIPRRMLSVQCVISPEQAVDATLGRVTCHDADVCGYFVCSECEALVKLHSIGRSYVDEWGKRWYATSNDHGFNYCPNCGRRVVNEQ